MSVCACKKVHTDTARQSIDVHILVDTTDPHILYPEANPILGSIFDFEHDPDKSATFRFTTISDKRFNNVIEYHIADGATSERHNKDEDPNYREKVVLGFYNAIRTTCADFSASCKSLKSRCYSECYAGIAGELVLLSQSKANQKVLLVFSDLQENTPDGFSCYTIEGQELLFSNQDTVMQILQSQQQFPNNLKGITVYFIFQPRTRLEDRQYFIMVNIYKRFLETRGARVIINTTNKYYQP